MSLRRARQDLDHLTSWILLAVTAATIVTGLVVHLWDLHGFVWHTYFGYALIAAVLLHLFFNSRQLFAYSGFRLRRLFAPRPGPRTPTRKPSRAPVGAAATTKSVLLSRRGLVGLTLGGTAGFLMGGGVARARPTLTEGSDLGVTYHQWSSDPGAIDAVGALRNLGRQPPLYKSYDVRTVVLERPSLAGGLTAEEAILRRQSVRAYSAEPMSGQELSRVLLMTGGHTTGGRRSHPSSGALYPIETYVVVHNVEDLAPGVYHYGPERHVLHELRSGDFREYVVRHGLNQGFLGECAAIVYLTMIFQRMRFKYGERSYRYGVIEAGHLGQNLYLAATSLGLGACAVGAYDDRGITDLLGIDGVEEVSVYLLSLGRMG
jgi:SagB-type dehydrogenase family enzyme